ncbi:helix-turn-helix domain-containing protein [Escherichia coli]|nr:helix-turn-helix domain-containing protein [Escherichia coli]
MLRATKIRIYPTPEQAAYFHERRSLNNGVFQGSCRLM